MMQHNNKNYNHAQGGAEKSINFGITAYIFSNDVIWIFLNLAELLQKPGEQDV